MAMSALWMSVVVVLCISASQETLVPFNITAVFDQSLESLKPVDRRMVKCKIVDSVVYWLSKALYVDSDRIDQSFRFNRNCPHGYYKESSSSSEVFCRDSCSNSTLCGPVPIPEKYLKPCSVCDSRGNCSIGSHAAINLPPNSQPQTHYLLFVSVNENTFECRSLDAIVDAGTCQQDKHTDRPVAGYLNFCPRHLRGRHSFSRMVSFVLHEMIRALGFSEDLLPFFRDSFGKPLMPRGSDGLPRRNHNGEYSIDFMISQTLVYNDWRNARQKEYSVRMITLPNVAEEASAHFGCPNMTGMPLEDQQTSKLLWESRLLWGDIMTGAWDRSREPVVSRLTLALLEDSGWYHPKYRYGLDLRWGKGMGCGFVNQSCTSFIEDANQALSPFCTLGKTQPVTGCNADHTYITNCSVLNYTDVIPRQFQNWKFSSHFGGNIPSSDYCPFRNLNSAHLDCTRESPQSSKLKLDIDPLMMFSTESKCIPHSKRWKMYIKEDKLRYREGGDWGAGCYRVQCKKDKFHVFVGDLKVTCNETGQLVSIKVLIGSVRYTGEIVCPAYDTICRYYQCHCQNGGACYSKNTYRCYCKAGFISQHCRFTQEYAYPGDEGHICNLKEFVGP